MSECVSANDMKIVREGKIVFMEVKIVMEVQGTMAHDVSPVFFMSYLPSHNLPCPKLSSV